MTGTRCDDSAEYDHEDAEGNEYADELTLLKVFLRDRAEVRVGHVHSCDARLEAGPIISRHDRVHERLDVLVRVVVELDRDHRGVTIR